MISRKATSQHRHRPWADLPADILGAVVGRLFLLEDRARLRSVCHAWRAAARLHRRPPPPLALLVLPDLSFSSFRAEGTTMTGARRRVPLPLPETTAEAGGGVRCVGSIDGWFVAVGRDKSRDFGGGDLRCFMMNAFSQEVVLLPSPSSAATTHLADEHSRSLPIANGGPGMVMNCTTYTAQGVMSFLKVILSSSPESGTGCVAAAISMVDKGTTKLALWRPGMNSWCVCYGSCVSKFTEVFFYQGKLYMLSDSELTTDLFSIELSDEEDNSGLMVSCVERCDMELLEAPDGYRQYWSIAEWRGKLLIVATYMGGAEVCQRIMEVRVFEAHLSTHPVRFTEIKSLDGDCIFISPCNSRSFRSCHYDGVEADRIYFIDGYLFPDTNFGLFYKFVYSMKDGTMTPFAADIPEDKLQTTDGVLMNPTWLFPPE